MKDINCPYCDHAQDINHDDGRGYEEDRRHEQQCENCEKNFVFTTSISYYYEVEKADCLNGEEHDYSPTHTSPNCFTVMQCSMCENTRELTESERMELGIETKESYFEKLKTK